MALKYKKNSGFIFLEIIIASALISIVFIALSCIGAQALNLSYSIKKTAQIDSLLKEEIEALRSFRDGTDWATNGLGAVNVTSSNPYYLSLNKNVNPPKWDLVPGIETIDAFTRNIVFDKVSRNPATKDIETVYNAYNNDPDTIKITVNVAWSNKTYQVVAYLTNWQK